ncbi:MAG: mechanosensitive ion channel [Acidobacteriota bacterium]|nr:mechanosensitive ion channel [Acidobacteriota bacterium]MDH3522912.1 mechanosensitive ion channel [Acidobacteriota bacterium]
MDAQTAQTVVDQIIPVLTSYGLQVLGAIGILVAGRIVAGLAGGMIRRGLTRAKVDPSLVGFGGAFAKGAIIAFAVIAALSKFGVQTTSFVAVIGAAGLAVGLALQGSLSNFAAGVLILLFRPFRVGDVVESSGSRGKVLEIGILATTLATQDNQKVILPNGALMNDKIVNVNAFPTRRVDLVASIGYGDDIEQARDVLHAVLAAHPKVLADPVPLVEVLAMADSSVDLAVRPWVETADYWPVYFDLNRSIKLELEKNGLTIPFPQRDVHLFQPAAAGN